MAKGLGKGLGALLSDSQDEYELRYVEPVSKEEEKETTTV